jgi:hypothetical protein
MRSITYQANQRALIVRLFDQGNTPAGGSLTAKKKFILRIRRQRWMRMRMLGKLASRKLKRAF